jgi:hypothetical protein
MEKKHQRVLEDSSSGDSDGDQHVNNKMHLNTGMMNMKQYMVDEDDEDQAADLADMMMRGGDAQKLMMSKFEAKVTKKQGRSSSLSDESFLREEGRGRDLRATQDQGRSFSSLRDP